MPDDRYFVTVSAPGRDQLRQLATRGLDLFMPTARKHKNELAIEGLLTLAEVGQLVDDGYSVLVEAPMRSRSRASMETTSAADWLQEMGE